MKLYTEEQLLNTIKSIRHYDDVYDEKVANERIEKHLKALHPIQLPTDEEIFQKSIEIMEEWYGSGCETEIDAHFRGAKWMRDKIQGGQQ